MVPQSDFLALVTACFYATYLLSIKYFRRWHSAPRLLFWASAVGALVLLPAALIHDGGQALIAYGLKGVPASLGAMTLLVQPVCTAGLGVLVLGQTLIPLQLIGGVVVLIGLGLAIRSKL